MLCAAKTANPCCLPVSSPSGSAKEIAAYIEAVANDLPAESRRQFERLGDFVTDRKER